MSHPRADFDPEHPQPGEAFQVIGGVQFPILPRVSRMLMALGDGDRAIFLIEDTFGRRWTLEPRDEHDGLRFVGRPQRDD